MSLKVYYLRHGYMNENYPLDTCNFIISNYIYLKNTSIIEFQSKILPLINSHKSKADNKQNHHKKT